MDARGDLVTRGRFREPVSEARVAVIKNSMHPRVERPSGYRPPLARPNPSLTRNHDHRRNNYTCCPSTGCHASSPIRIRIYQNRDFAN